MKTAFKVLFATALIVGLASTVAANVQLGPTLQVVARSNYVGGGRAPASPRGGRLLSTCPSPKVAGFLFGNGLKRPRGIWLNCSVLDVKHGLRRCRRMPLRRPTISRAIC